MSALTHAAPERERLSLAETLTDSRVITVRQLRKVLRRPVYVVSAFVQPVLFVLMFRYVFGGAIHTGSVDYVDFVMPGIMVQTAIFGALITGMGLTEDMAAGVVDRFRSLPMARSAVLVGRTAAAPILFDAFARSGKLPAALPKPPRGALIASNAKLPLPLKRFRPAGDLVSADREQALKIQFPLNGSRIEAGGLGSDALNAVPVKVAGGVMPMTMLLSPRCTSQAR